MTPAIEIERLTKRYGRARGIVDVDLVVETGSVFGFLGPNGAGKTTTIRVLLDLLRPTTGRARLLGLDSHLDSVEIHRRVGYVGGDPALFERLTGGELLEWLGRLRGGVDRTAIDALSERLGLDRSRPIRALSSGNRQKITLVQAFMHEPELLLLDEPTAGLDPLVQRTFEEMVREVAQDGRTVLLSSHRLEEVEDICDSIAMIRDGRLIATESMSDVRNRALRNITIRFAEEVDVALFRALPRVEDVRLTGKTLTLRAQGELDDLVKLVSRYRVSDFVSAPPALEELFLSLYRDEEPRHAP